MAGMISIVADPRKKKIWVFRAEQDLGFRPIRLDLQLVGADAAIGGVSARRDQEDRADEGKRDPSDVHGAIPPTTVRTRTRPRESIIRGAVAAHSGARIISARPTDDRLIVRDVGTGLCQDPGAARPVHHDQR
ncbi:MAG: hypothetical protein ABIR79_02245 [Candidatus Binatia bacterium]